MMGRRLSIVRIPPVRGLICSVILTFEAVGLVAVEALGVCTRPCQLRNFEVSGRRWSVRFLTIATCFFAATIFKSGQYLSGDLELLWYALCRLVVAVSTVLTLEFFEVENVCSPDGGLSRQAR